MDFAAGNYLGSVSFNDFGERRCVKQRLEEQVLPKSGNNKPRVRFKGLIEDSSSSSYEVGTPVGERTRRKNIQRVNPLAELHKKGFGDIDMPPFGQIPTRTPAKTPKSPVLTPINPVIQNEHPTICVCIISFHYSGEHTGYEDAVAWKRVLTRLGIRPSSVLTVTDTDVVSAPDGPKTAVRRALDRWSKSSTLKSCNPILIISGRSLIVDVKVPLNHFEAVTRCVVELPEVRRPFNTRSSNLMDRYLLPGDIYSCLTNFDSETCLRVILDFSNADLFLPYINNFVSLQSGTSDELIHVSGANTESSFLTERGINIHSLLRTPPGIAARISAPRPDLKGLYGRVSCLPNPSRVPWGNAHPGGRLLGNRLLHEGHLQCHKSGLKCDDIVVLLASTTWTGHGAAFDLKGNTSLLLTCVEAAVDILSSALGNPILAEEGVSLRGWARMIALVLGELNGRPPKGYLRNVIGPIMEAHPLIKKLQVEQLPSFAVGYLRSEHSLHGRLLGSGLANIPFTSEEIVESICESIGTGLLKALEVEQPHWTDQHFYQKKCWQLLAIEASLHRTTLRLSSGKSEDKIIVSNPRFVITLSDIKVTDKKFGESVDVKILVLVSGWEKPRNLCELVNGQIVRSVPLLIDGQLKLSDQVELRIVLLGDAIVFKAFAYLEAGCLSFATSIAIVEMTVTKSV